MALQAGTTLGPYQVTAKIGEGGMGEVYKARDTRLDRTVAIKVLPEAFTADPDLKQRFEREAKTISSLNHPHICTLSDIGSQDGMDFLVMEYLDGETLAQRLETRISDLAMVLYRQDKSPRLDFWGSDVRSHTTEGDTLWVNYKPRPFSSPSMAF